MTTLQYKFSPSTNIIWDKEANLNYIPTPNSKRIFKQLIDDYQLGIRAFNIVGTYGSGKSSFVWAFEKNINKEREDFEGLNGHFKNIESFNYIPIVGEYKSLQDTLSLKLGCNNNKQQVIEELDNLYKNRRESNQGLLIVIDEFGKFLEFASKTNPEKELYFIQQLTEYINDLNKEIILITTLHQDFNSYSFKLEKNQKQEWDKVKGRLKEITFNEPVEQLLYLASERLDSLPSKQKDKHFFELYKAIKEADVFPLKSYFDINTAKKLLPFDILSASILTLSLQKYGQNERSLFSFIESNDVCGIKDYDKRLNPFYNLSCVYDYLIQNFYSLLSTKYNPDYSSWCSIRTSIERAEGVIEKNIIDAIKIIKTIGLMNIFIKSSVKINKEFLLDYGNFSLGLSDPEETIRALVSHKIIKYVRYAKKYVLFEGTDVDIEIELEKASNLISREKNVVNSLNKYFDFPTVPAKAYTYIKGTPRFFTFVISDKPVSIEPTREIDGFINIVFSSDLTEEEIILKSKESKEAILFGYFTNVTKLQELIAEIEKAKIVKQQYSEDKVATRELNSIINHDIDILNDYVLENIYSIDSPINWYYRGDKIEIDERQNFNRILSKISNDVYHSTPIFINEMVNKTKVSSAISTARKNLIERLVNGHKEKNLGIPEDKFPPEKTIYLSLLHNTGIHKRTNNKNGEIEYVLKEPDDKSFKKLWDASYTFLRKAKATNKNLIELYDLLSKKPFKLKQGFIDFYIPVFLFIHKDEFALFHDNSYVPNINEDILELINKKPNNFSIKTFNLEGNREKFFKQYRSIMNQSLNVDITNQTFIETIKPFLVFYKELPEYSKKTDNISEKAINLRNAVKSSRSPEKTFFEELPIALGYNPNNLINNIDEFSNYFTELQDAIHTIKCSYDELVKRIENFINQEFLGEDLKFPLNKQKLIRRFDKLKKEALSTNQIVFYQRLSSTLDDKSSWINSIAYACIDKSLENFNDEDELKFYNKLRLIIKELDNLCDISQSDIELDKEDVLKIEITSFVEGLQKNLVRAPKLKNKNIETLKKSINDLLSDDKNTNIITLIKLLQDQLKDEQ